MRNYNFKTLISLGLIVMMGFIRCNKVETGFISDNMYYIENPLVTSQGTITVSSSIVEDGSTDPVSVQLTKVTDASGNDVMALLTKTDSIMGFSGSISYLDSTIALLNKKISVTAAVPLSVNPIGGRIQLTPATQFVSVGAYSIDIKVSNIRGTKTIPNACKIIIGGAGSPDTVYAGTYAGMLDNNTLGYAAALANPNISVTYTPSQTNKLVYKFFDKNGKVYNPKAGGIFTRPSRWSMKQFDPYYPEVLTDTSVEYQFPSVPNQFPVFVNPGVNGIIPRGNYGVFPAFPATSNDSGHPIFAFLDMAFFQQGTYVINTTFTDIAWK